MIGVCVRLCVRWGVGGRQVFEAVSVSVPVERNPKAGGRPELGVSLDGAVSCVDGGAAAD